MAQRNQISRTNKPSWMKGTGPYVGRVVNHLDSEYNGQLEVEILKITEAGNAEEGSGYFIPCQQISPFYGVTPRKGVTENPQYDYTQKSYGIWAVPPDIGVRVLVLFAEEQFGYGYWFGCLPDKNMNFMLPGYASTTYNDKDKSSPVPVGEYNKAIEKGTGKDATQYIKPHSPDALAQLQEQGLDKDHIRGTTTSSARREIPSNVYGWSTPGGYDRRPNKPTVKYGEKFAESNVPFNRLGGHSFVMDDGDQTLLRKGHPSITACEYVNFEAGERGGDQTLPHNDLLRLRTRTGHQILLHNSEDLIYIGNSTGSTWIEMTSNGKIDIFANDSVSIHTQNDFNFKADRDINIEAGNNVNIKAGNQMMTETGANWEVKVGADGKITCAGTSNIKSAHHFETAGRIDMNGPAAAEAGSAPVPIRVPQHEPWAGHENLNPENHTPEKTNVDPAAGNTEVPETLKPVPDTFRKSS